MARKEKLDIGGVGGGGDLQGIWVQGESNTQQEAGKHNVLLLLNEAKGQSES